MTMYPVPLRGALGTLGTLSRVACLASATLMAGLLPSVAVAAYAPAPGHPTNNGSQQTAYGPMASGAGYESTLESSGQYDFYSFFTRPQDRLTLSLSEPTGFAGAIVLDADGNTVCGGGTQAVSGSPITCVPGAANTPASGRGEYYVEVAPGAAVTPDAYTVSVTGPVFDYNPVRCSAAQARLRQAKAAASKHLRAARRAHRGHHGRTYRHDLAAYRREKRAVSADQLSAHTACTG